MAKYYYELHTHTRESSGCAGVCAADSYKMLKEAGASGMVVTDHFQFWPGEEIYDSEHWRGKVDYLLKGYRALKEASSDDPDFTVLLGFEYRNCSNDNDILVFGATEEFLYKNEWFGNLDRASLRKLADENGILLVQAHPFRGNCKPEAPDFIHGVEVYNEVPRHDSKNGLALARSGACYHNGLFTVTERTLNRPAQQAQRFHKILANKRIWEELIKLTGKEPVRPLETYQKG